MDLSFVVENGYCNLGVWIQVEEAWMRFTSSRYSLNQNLCVELFSPTNMSFFS